MSRFLHRKFSTHVVFNQSLPFRDYNVFQTDQSLVKAIDEFVPKNQISALTHLSEVGKFCGSETYLDHSELAQRNRPTLRQFDNYGRRVDTIDYHPSYHVLMDKSLQAGGAAYGYNNSVNNPSSHTVRAAIIYMLNQLEPGHCCPIVMTCASVPVLKRTQSETLLPLLTKLKSQVYDPRNVPIEQKKVNLLFSVVRLQIYEFSSLK